MIMDNDHNSDLVRSVLRRQAEGEEGREAGLGLGGTYCTVIWEELGKFRRGGKQEGRGPEGEEAHEAVSKACSGIGRLSLYMAESGRQANTGEDQPGKGL